MARLKKKDCNITINAYRVLYPPKGKTTSQMIDQLCYEIKVLFGYNRIIFNEEMQEISTELAEYFGIEKKDGIIKKKLKE